MLGEHKTKSKRTAAPEIAAPALRTHEEVIGWDVVMLV
jgi:hypothetical protein